MQKRESQNNGYTSEVLARVSKYSGTTEYAVIRELCALYDQFCTCVATLEQRIYLKRRIETYEKKLYERAD